MRKKLSLILGGLVCLSLFAFTTGKIYIFKFNETQINHHWQNLEAIKVMMDQSALPHNQVKQAVAAIDSLQKDMQRTLTIDTSGLTIN
jgi:hypothetical protein